MTSGKKHLRTPQRAPSEAHRLWRSTDEPVGGALDDPESFQRMASLYPRYAELVRGATDRRTFLKLMTASLGAAGLSTLGLTGCTGRSDEEIVPYVDAPEHVVPGRPSYYASTLTLGGYGFGVLAESHQGRPTKIEGNRAHPSTLGAAGPQLQAATMGLFDPDRSRTVLENGEIRAATDFERALLGVREDAVADKGRGLRLLTPPVTSPTMARGIDALLEKFPAARWHQWQPFNADARLAGTRLAFGRDLDTVLHASRAEIIVQLDGDFLSDLPGSLAYAREFARRRRPEKSMSRLYVAESTPGLAGAMADHGLPVAAPRVGALARALAHRLGLPIEMPVADLTEDESRWISACASDLDRHRGRGLVVCGDNQPPVVHALVHWINDHLGNVGETVTHIEPVLHRPEPLTDSLAGLVADMRAGDVDALIVIDANPVYDAPADFNFADAMERVAFTVHHGAYVDEAAQRSGWHVPLAHDLESWGDARAHDGTASIQQPLIHPMHGGRSRLALPALLAGGTTGDRDMVQAYWAERFGADADRRWHESLQSGVVVDSAHAAVSATPDRDRIAREVAGIDAGPASLTLQFRPDPHIGDGRHANNAWLQELPRPLTKLTWDNALLMAPGVARARELANEDVVRVRAGGRSLEVPVWIMPGHPEDAVTLEAGYGRDIAGHGGDALINGHGVNAFEMRDSDHMAFRSDVVLEPTGATRPLASTQQHHDMQGRDMVRHATLEAFRADPDFVADDHAAHDPEISLYPEPTPEPFDESGPQWGMSIDLNACIGCMACTAACQAENNIPVVGKEQVRAGREMHWIRVDRYYSGEARAPRTFFQPVPCQHCENAPCEYVCPVAATLHDSEGLNVMVYNRCIGTRNCSQNCPYKVRRFNFLEYNYKTAEPDLLAALQNPDVTVRSRGVMEKCTYCIQRISRARREAKKEDRAIRDGEVQTACQQACPAEAIVFGDISDASTGVSEAKRNPLEYNLLAELNTRPRTSYRACIRNARGEPEEEPAPDVGRSDGGHSG